MKNYTEIFSQALKMKEGYDVKKPVILIKTEETGQIFDIDNTIRVFSYKSNLWKSTLEKDVPNLATRINAVVNNIGIDKSYFDTFMGNN